MKLDNSNMHLKVKVLKKNQKQKQKKKPFQTWGSNLWPKVIFKVWCSTNRAISPDDFIWAKTGSSRTFTFDCVSRDDQKNHSFSLGIYTIFRLFKTTFLTRVVCMFAQLANIRTADLAFTLSLISMIEYALQMAHFSPLRTSKMRGFFRISAWWSTCVNKAIGSIWDGLWPFSTRLNSRDSLCAVLCTYAWPKVS